MPEPTTPQQAISKASEKSHRPKANPPRFTPDPLGRYCDRITHTADRHLCDQQPGSGTPHKGTGPCRFHGGLTPIKHGRYSKMRREELRDLISQYEADPDPLNILPELAAMRALFQDYIDRYDQNREALIAWYETSLRGGGEPERPRQILDIADASRLLTDVTRIAKRIEDIRAQNAVSRQDLLRILSEMSNVVALHVTHEETRQRIKDGWSSIRL